MREVTMEELAYTAGLLDGEGCCHIGNAKGHFAPLVQVASTHEVTLRWLSEIFGIGTIVKGMGCKKPVYRWNITRYEDILDFLWALHPYLHIKLEHSDLMISYLESRANGRNGRHSLSLEEMELRAFFKSRFTILNGRIN